MSTRLSSFLPWLALASAARWLAALRTDVPGRDGASYLWMAEQAAAGHIEALFATVFHPLYPALVALLLGCVPGLDPVLAGQWVSCGAGALAIVPLGLLAHRQLGPAAAQVGMLGYALGLWFCRHPAECMSEGPFFLLVPWTVLALHCGRVRSAGVLGALAYAARPEGGALWLCLLPWLLRRGRYRQALEFTLAYALVALCLPLGYWHFGSGFTLTPKAGFTWADGAGGATAGVLVHYLTNLGRLVGVLFEALGPLTVPCIALGVCRRREWLLLAPFALFFGLIPLLRSHERFLLGYGLLLLPCAGLGLAWLAARVPLRPRTVGVLLLLLVARDLVLLPEAWQRERLVEKHLGRHLRRELRPGERVATEMPRLEYFAGQQPGPPRAVRADEVLAACTDPATRYVVFVAPRTPIDPAELARRGFTPAVIEGDLGLELSARNIRIFERKR